MGAISFEPRAATPVLPERAVGLEIVLAPRDEDDEGAGCLFGAWRIPASLGRPALRAVAIDAASGEVFERALSAEVRERGAVSLDLALQLALPPGDRTFAVFLWAGELASRLCFFRPEAPPPLGAFAAFTGGPEEERGDIELALADGWLRASVFAPGRAEGPLARPVVLLADHGERLRVLREPAPEAADCEWRFSARLDALVDAGARRVAVLAFAADMLSDVLLVRP